MARSLRAPRAVAPSACRLRARPGTRGHASSRVVRAEVRLTPEQWRCPVNVSTSSPWPLPQPPPAVLCLRVNMVLHKGSVAEVRPGPFVWRRTVRCAKSRLFSHTGSHRSRGPEFCTLQPPCWYTRDFFVSVMLATGPGVLNSAPPMPF